MYRTHTPEAKAKLVIEALRGERTVNEIASANNIHPNQLTKWKNDAIASLPTLFESENSKLNKQKKQYQEQVDDLYKQIGKLTMELDWAKKKSGGAVLPK
jgi:transposase-like protein